MGVINPLHILIVEGIASESDQSLRFSSEAKPLISSSMQVVFSRGNVGESRNENQGFFGNVLASLDRHVKFRC